jgi:phage minor structural protein
MIRIFGQTDTVFTSNGDCVVSPLKAKVHKADNGDYYLDLETDLSYIDYFVEGNIVVANTPTGEQAFRIDNPTKSKNKLVSKCWHVSYSSKNHLIADSYVVDMDCNDALNHLNDAAEPASPFTVHSDVGVVDSYRCVRESLHDAIIKVQERWGGHIVRDNFDIAIMSAIGVDNGIIVQYKKNLSDITCQDNWDNVVTKLLPVGKDGLLLNALDETADIYLTSSTQYDLPYTKAVTFSQDEIVEEDYESEEAYKQALVKDLRMQGLDYLTANCVPLVNYTLKANLDRVTDIGDVIEVIDERLGLHLMTQVISFTYDCIFKKYTEVEFGNFTQSLSGLIKNITVEVNHNVTDQVNNVATSLQSQLTQATGAIMGILGDSYVINTGSDVMLVDSLPKEDATNVMRMNQNGVQFSQSGINGPFAEVWNINGDFNAENVNFVNLIADMIKGGTLKRGGHSNLWGNVEYYDNSNRLIGKIDSDGLTLYADNGATLIIDHAHGVRSYDADGNTTLAFDGGKVTSSKTSITEELEIGEMFKFIPMQVSQSGTVVNSGIGLVFSGGDS